MKILFVCMGNICRSPLAAVAAGRAFQDAGLIPRIGIDSAGTLDYHAGRPADARSIALAAEAGLDLGPHRARQVRADDFRDFELIVAMDRRNIADLRRVAPASAWGRIRLLMSFAGQAQGEVPDPYHGGRTEFERSFSLIRDGVAGLTKHLVHLHNPGSTSPE
jgi:protein-tyrosine phosphatase